MKRGTRYFLFGFFGFYKTKKQDYRKNNGCENPGFQAAAGVGRYLQESDRQSIQDLRQVQGGQT